MTSTLGKATNASAVLARWNQTHATNLHATLGDFLGIATWTTLTPSDWLSPTRRRGPHVIG